MPKPWSGWLQPILIIAMQWTEQNRTPSWRPDTLTLDLCGTLSRNGMGTAQPDSSQQECCGERGKSYNYSYLGIPLYDYGKVASKKHWRNRNYSKVPKPRSICFGGGRHTKHLLTVRNVKAQSIQREMENCGLRDLCHHTYIPFLRSLLLLQYLSYTIDFLPSRRFWGPWSVVVLPCRIVRMSHVGQGAIK